MVTYEITAEVRADLCQAYERFMRERHIPDLLATETFVAASISREKPGLYRIRYEARDRPSLDLYLRDHAPRLREDFARHFPEGIEVSRMEWNVIQTWSVKVSI